jgi:hypothetical protein
MATKNSGGFAQMPKMMTDEPSVILKLKKGGHVAKKHHSEHGHKAMSAHHIGEEHNEMHSVGGTAPKKPSIMERRKSMKAPMLMSKKGGVAKKANGGMMGAPMGAPIGAGAMMNPAIKKALMMRMMAQRGAMRPGMAAPAAPMAAPMGPAMKKGGMAKGGDMAQDKTMIKKAFMQHDMQEHKGGKGTHLKLKHGGKVHPISGCAEGSLEHHKHMAKHHAKMHKEGGSHHHKKMAEHHKAMCSGGKYAEGGAIDKFETKTTIEGNAKKFDKTKMVDGQHHDKHYGTGMVKEGKPGGFKHGGKVHHKATGGDIPVDTNKRVNKGKIVMGGTIEGNEHDYENTDMHEADKDHAHGTSGVSMANAGGFKHGGKIMHKAMGGSTNWENRAADTARPGKTNTKTGEVKESNAGGYKKGGAAKKHFATGGSVNDAGKAVKMPRHFVSAPVANSLQSGTFKKGGKVKKFSGGNLETNYPTADDDYDPIIKREADRRAAEETTTRSENEATPVMDSVKRLLGIRPNAGAGRGFVNPTMTRKTGGRAC